MKKQMFEPASIKLTIESPQTFRDIVFNDAYAKEEVFIGYGNPAAKVLIVGQEVTWRKDIDQLNEYNIYCKRNIADWRKNLQQKEVQQTEVTIQGDIQHPEDGVTTEAYERFNPLYPHYLRFNKKLYIRNKDWHTSNYGASSTWIHYQQLIDSIYNRPAPTIIDFVTNCFITELSGEARPHNIEVDKNRTKEKIKEEIKKQAEATEKSIAKRCPLLNEPFFQNFPIIILACGQYASKILPYTFGLGKDFKKELFESKGGYKVFKTNDRIVIWTRQLSDHRGNPVKPELIRAIADEVLPYRDKAIQTSKR